MAIQQKDKRARDTQDWEGEPLPKKKKKKKKRAPEAEPTSAKKALPETEQELAQDEGEGEGDAGAGEGAIVVRGGESASLDRADDDGAEPSQAAREGDAEEGEDDEPAAAQLGVDRFVLAAFFAVGMVGAYVLGRMIHGVWSTIANKDWFSQNLPRLAAVNDDDKGTIGVVIGGIIALVAVFKSYRRPDIREWADEVAAELTKVKWPTKKDVTNSTLVVIAASTVATVYLFLLDRLWAFITNLVYGTGS